MTLALAGVPRTEKVMVSRSGLRVLGVLLLLFGSRSPSVMGSLQGSWSASI